MKDPGYEKVYQRYTKGVQFNNQIGLYDTVENNENFYIGKQWEGVQANGNPTPVFKVLKRVTSFQVAKITSDNFSIQVTPLSSTSEYSLGDVERICDVINKQFAALVERNKLVSKTRVFTRNAGVDGDGATYTYFDPGIETGQTAKGDIVTEIVENTRVLFGNPNDNDVQAQPWVIICLRKPVDEVKRMAKKNGQDENAIHPDRELTENYYDSLMDNKVTLLVYLEKDPETGTIWAGKYTQGGAVEEFRDTELRLYPITWMNWDYVQDCYHGHALISQLIPNQVFINQMFALTMRSLMTTAFPKILYDKTRIPNWDGGVGKAIAINGGGDINTVARVMDPATISPQVAQFIEMAIDYTQSLMGASDAALGDTRPDNTSAIIALQRASDAPLEVIKQNVFQALEDLARVYLDMMRVYYGVRFAQVKLQTKAQMNNQPLGMTLPEQDFNQPFDFVVLNEIPLSLKVDVGASSYWSEIAAVQTLDNLLMQKQITVDEYLERLPEGYVSKKQELIDKRRGINAAPVGGQAPTAPMMEIGQPLPVEGGKGYGQLQRALNTTGVA